MTHLRKWRAASVGAVLGAGALVLSACTAGTSADDEDSFSFGFPTSNNLESPYETLAVAFMESHPGVSIQLNPQPSDSYAQNIRTQLQAGNAPDVLQVTPGRGSGQGVLLLAEADFLEPLGTTASDLIPETNRELFEENGQTYAQPLDFTVQGLVTNEGAVQRVLESFPEDTGQLLADCKTAAGRGESFMAVAGVAANQAALLAVTIAAGRVYADTPEWDVQRASGSTTFAQSPGWTDTLETIVRMKDAGCLQPGAEGAGFDAITNGLSLGSSLTSAIPGGAATEIMRAAPDQEFTVHPFPADSPDTAWVYGSANYALSITAASRKKRAAQDFLDWIAEPEQAKLFSDASGALPVTGFDGMDLDGTIYGPVGGLLKEGRFSPQPSNVWPNQEVYQSLGVGVQGLLTGQTTVETVLESMDSAWR